MFLEANLDYTLEILYKTAIGTLMLFSVLLLASGVELSIWSFGVIFHDLLVNYPLAPVCSSYTAETKVKCCRVAILVCSREFLKHLYSRFDLVLLKKLWSKL